MNPGVDDDEGQKIVTRLLDLTHRRKLQWAINHGGIAEGAYCFTKRWKYEVCSRDLDGFAPFEVNVYGPRSDTDNFPFRFEIRTEDDELNYKIAALFEAASRSATGLDVIVNDVLDDLDAVDSTVEDLI